MNILLTLLIFTFNLFSKIKIGSMLAIGLMSGTSLDGIDAALIETDGEQLLKPLANFYLPYSLEFQDKLRAVIATHLNWLEVEIELTELHARAVNELITKYSIPRETIKVIGFAQQTIFHAPRQNITWQIGNPHLLKTLVNISVISDFRRSDVANGGEGAPLVPIFHKCLAQKLPKPACILNIGGVANLTYISEDQLIAFDCGPGNALLNDVMLKHFNQTFDKNGEIARQGKVNQQILAQLLDDQFFTAPYPKSIDRHHFDYAKELLSPLAATDQIATLANFTAAAIIKSLAILPKKPEVTLLCGGGSHNLAITAPLAAKLNTQSMATLGLDADFIEAQAFAYLAVRNLQGLPITFPTTTKVSKPTVIGTLS